jgi:Cof subfamily protein (haloacid dehalogenase superfamily)
MRDPSSSPGLAGSARALRIVALDLDGTLLRSDGTISTRTRAALRAAEASGLTLLSVTARPPRRVRAIAEHSGLHGLAICSNGSVLYDITTGQLRHELRLEAAAVAQLVTQLRAAAPGVTFAVEAGARYGCEPSYVIQREHPHDAQDPAMLRADALELSRDGVTKLIVQHAQRGLAELLQLTREHAGALASVTHSGSDFVEVAAASVSKALALEHFCGTVGATAAHVVAFGDMPNDLPMLLWAGHAVAVANAHPEVRAAAQTITRSNDEDGVAQVLENLVEQRAARTF